MYIVFTAERVEDYWEKIPVVESITKYKDNVDKYILNIGVEILTKKILQII